MDAGVLAVTEIMLYKGDTPCSTLSSYCQTHLPVVGLNGSRLLLEAFVCVRFFSNYLRFDFFKNPIFHPPHKASFTLAP